MENALKFFLLDPFVVTITISLVTFIVIIVSIFTILRRWGD